jgi:two-component system sensor histidine kinase TctE
LGEPYPYDVLFRAEQMRAVKFPQPIATPSGIVNATVLVAETVNARGQLFRSLWFGQMLQQVLLVVGAAGLIWIGISRELGPLLGLADNVRRRKPDELEPIPAQAVQPELRPLIVALNDFMARLERQVTRQRDFLDTAAHQLRTPLSVLKMQVEYALRTNEAAEKDETLRAIDSDLSAVGRLTNQLLVMARSEHDRPTMAIEPVDLSEVARDVIAAAAPRALDAGIDIGLEAPDPCILPANSQLVREMVRNLVDNVILYAGASATALVSLRTEGASIRIRVMDTGKGVSSEDRGRIFQRFQRGRDAPGFGSGLGLSIVSEIASLFGGNVALPEPAGGKGFIVEITFPHPETLPGENS